MLADPPGSLRPVRRQSEDPVIGLAQEPQGSGECCRPALLLGRFVGIRTGPTDQAKSEKFKEPGRELTIAGSLPETGTRAVNQTSRR